MTQKEKFELAVRLLKELNCPEEILDALWLFGMTVHDDEIKLHNWLAEGGVIGGEARELDEPLLETVIIY